MTGRGKSNRRRAYRYCRAAITPLELQWLLNIWFMSWTPVKIAVAARLTIDGTNSIKLFTSNDLIATLLTSIVRLFVLKPVQSAVSTLATHLVSSFHFSLARPITDLIAHTGHNT